MDTGDGKIINWWELSGEKFDSTYSHPNNNNQLLFACS